jgi:oligopeptide transport system substrate-binding protein
MLVKRRQLLALGGALGLAGCSGGRGRADQATLFRGVGDEPSTLDLSRIFDGPGTTIAYDLFEPLLALSAEGRYVPGAAERWEASADGIVWRFHLRSSARWSNGEPVTAEDFVFAWRRLVDPAIGAPFATMAFAIDNAQGIAAGDIKDLGRLGVRAVSPVELEVRLARPSPFFIDQVGHFAMAPLHRATVGTDEGWSLPGRMVSNGPYRLTARRRGESVALEKNPFYWAAAEVATARVEHVQTADSALEVLRFRSGELDLTNEVPAGQVAWLRSKLGEQVRLAPRLGVNYIAFNMTDPRVADPRIRRALAMGVERDIIARDVMRGGETPAYRFMPPSLDPGRTWAPDWTAWPRERRIAQAHALFKAAGFEADRPFPITLSYDNADLSRSVMVAVAAMWRDLPVSVRLEGVEQRVMQAYRRQGRFMLARSNWVADYPHPYNFLELFRSDAGAANAVRYFDPAFDALLDAAARAPRGDLAALHQAEARLLAADIVIPLNFFVGRHLISPRLAGWRDNPLDLHLSRWLSLRPQAS